MSGIDFANLDKGPLREKWTVELDDYIIELAWSPSAPKIAAVTVEGLVFLIDDLKDSGQFKLIGRHEAGGNSLSWRHDGAEFATAGQDGLVKIWDGDTGEELKALDAGNSWVSKVLYSPRHKVLATAAGKHLKLWNEQYEATYESSDHLSTVADVGWNPDGSGIAAAAYYGITVHVPGKQKQPRKYSWKGSSLSLAWSPDAKYIATGEQDSTVHFWHLKSGQDAQMYGFPTKVLELNWHPSGKWLATSGGAAVCLWDCSGKGPAGKEPVQYDAHLTKLTDLAFHPEGEMLASTDKLAYLLLWHPFKNKEVSGGLSLSSSASCIKWSNEGKLAVGQEDGKVLVLEVEPNQ